MHKIMIEEKLIDGIPLNEYVDLNCEVKGLVFVQHGFASNKERGTDYIAIKLAREGFLVVSIDAYKHGKRMKEPFISEPIYKQYFDIFTVVKKTARDIDRLFKKYYLNQFEKYDIVGISMGGMIAFYLTTISKHLSHVVPVISAPDFLQMSLDTFCGDLKEFQPFIYKKEAYIKRISPVERIEKMRFDKMLMMNTTNDDMVNYKITKQFFEEKSLGNTFFRLYEDTHNVNREMQEDIIKFMLNHPDFAV
ncbi:MAG: alpha/beta hydrolase family protein [Candidatus Izemoplasmataceae bacterium]